MTRHSPYNYGFDNPIRFIDPDGRGPDDPWWKVALDAGIRLLTGKSGDVPEEVPMDNRTRQIVKVSGEINDATVVAKATVKTLPKKMARKTPSVLQKAADATKVAAYGGAPFTEGGSMALIVPAEVLEKTGTAMQFGYDLKDGKYNDAAFTLLSTGVSHVVGRSLDKAQEAKKITNTDKGILSFISDAWSKVSDYIYDKSKDEKK